MNESENKDVVCVFFCKKLRSGKRYRVCDEGAEEELREIEMMEANNVGGSEDESDDEEFDDDEDTSNGTGEDDSEGDLEF